MKILLKALCASLIMPYLFCEQNNQDTLTFTVSSDVHHYEKKKILLACIGDVDSIFLSMAESLKKDLEFTGQWDVAIKLLPVITLKNEIVELFKKGNSFIIFLNQTPDKSAIEWRLYDKSPTWFAQPDIHMIKGAKHVKQGSVVRGWAHTIADSLWPLLTGQEGFFSTRIAYCKDVRCPRKKKVKHIYIADYDGSNEQVLVSMPTVSVAPRWNHDIKNPLLFYSEYTNANVRLIAVNMEKKRKIASNFDGINMLPSFSPDGKKVVYCASKGKGNCQLYYYENGIVKKLIDNGGNNVSPTFSEDGSKIYFCSDFQTGSPQIYCFDLILEKLTRLTDGGYCASPCYCPQQRKLAYSKIISGIMQLFVYDVATNSHSQLTFDKGHKEECSWSPCGNYILHSNEHGTKSRIAMLNIITNECHFLTSATMVCTYPAWSPIYEQFPVVT